MTAKPLKKIIQGQAYRIVLWQFAGVAIVALCALPIRGITSSFSVFAGGMAYCLPNLIFVWRVFQFAGAKQMTQFITAFFLGEIMKLALSAILFLVIVKYLPVSLLSELVGFASAIVLFWIVCMWQFSLSVSNQQGVSR